ncbi:DUF5590 domain-containing protein [uncultured Clostridium sp.]|uniref:cell wall elongation regulator TseB-like domain-containing protein n=1 Tax=uncultured Clostridium sp. TaxID=59620 RepID=UPI0026202AD3|nr:DUF5590 domain-containing protein [uncultured Clostridium sp.]
MKKKNILAWGISGICIGILMGVVTSKDLFEEETRYVQSRKKIQATELKNIENKEADKSELIKRFRYERDMEYSDINYEDGTLYFKSYLFDITEEMKFNDGLNIQFEGDKLSWVMEIDKKFYGVVSELEKGDIEVEKNKIISNRTGKETKLNAFLVEFKLDEKDGKLKEIGREKKTFEEYLNEKENKEYGKFYSSEVKEYKDKNKETVEEEKIKAVKLMKEKYNIAEVEHIEVFNSDNRYYLVIGYNKKIEPVYILGDRKENKEYLIENENFKIQLKSMFSYEDRILGADRFGNIFEFNIDKDNVVMKELSENEIRKKNQGEFHMIGMIDEYVYFRNYLPIDSLTAYNIKEQKFSVVYESEFKTMDGIDMKDGYISLYIEPGVRAQKMIGKLKGNKIETIIDEIPYVKGSTDYINNDILIMEALNDQPEWGQDYGTEIRVYKLNK